MNLDFRSSNTTSVAQKLKLPDHPGQSSLFGLSSADHSMEDYDVAGVPGVNRSHTRAILAPVTQPLVKFISTKHLVEAIRDAIKGHQALTECGILHQDISPSNVFLTASGQFRGSLHDLDHSVYARERPSHDNDSQLATLSSRIPRTVGTFQFLARDILYSRSHCSKHDLESFFWLLSWVCFRHVDHGGTMDIVEDVFKFRNPHTASLSKYGWLLEVTMDSKKDKRHVEVRRNKPLTRLFYHLICLLLVSCVKHDKMLRVFEVALNSQGWPEKDGLRSTPVSSNTIRAEDSSNELSTPGTDNT